MQKQFIQLSLFLIFCAYTNAVEFKADCTTTSECTALYTDSYVCVNSFCEHEPVSFADPIQITGLVVLIIVSALANAGGIGGGALIIPVYMFIFDYTVGHSVPLSKATILAGAIVNIIMIVNQRNPNNKNQLLVDYKVGTFIVPLILAGTMIGVLFTKMLPSIVIFVVLVLYLIYSTIKTFIKARKLFKKETIKKLEAEEFKQQAEDNKAERGFDSGVEEKSLQEMEPSDLEIKVEEKLVRKKSLCSLLKEYIIHILVCIFCYIVLLVVSLMRGGKGTDSIIGLDKCSAVSWILFVVTQFICLGGSLFLYFMEKRKVKKEEPVTNPKEEEETDDSAQTVDTQSSVRSAAENVKLMKLLFFNSYLAGILAGTLGIGGGLVINPVLIKLNIMPEVSAAISGFVVLFTSLATTTQFLIVGAFEVDAVIYFLVASAVGSVLGNIVIIKIMKKYQRPSLIVWLLFFLLLCSAVVLPLVGGMKIFGEDSLFKFGSAC